MKGIFLLAFLWLLASCAGARVNYDHDKETDFSAYNTYNFYPDLETGLSDLDTKRLLDVLDVTLRSKGLVFSEEPDFYINIESKSFQGPQRSSVGVGLGGGGRSVGGGVSVGIPVGRANVQRQIRFDFVDARKDALFWQAVSETTFKENMLPDQREEKLRVLVEKVFSKYPPKSKK